MVFDAQNQRVIGGVKRISLDRVGHDFLEQNLGCQSPSVIDDRLPIIAIPTIH